MPTIQGLHIKAGKEIPANLKNAIGEDKLRAFVAEKFNLTSATKRPEVNPDEEKEDMGSHICALHAPEPVKKVAPKVETPIPKAPEPAKKAAKKKVK